MNMQKVYDHKGNFKDVEVGLLDFTLYKLRPRLDNESPKDRIAKVQETKEAIEKYIHHQALLARQDELKEIAWSDNLSDKLKDELNDKYIENRYKELQAQLKDIEK